MKDKVKRKRILADRKINSHAYYKNQDFNPNSDNYEFIKDQEKYRERLVDYEKILIQEKKLKLAKQKAKKLNQEFYITHKNKYKTRSKIQKEYKIAKLKRKQIIKELKQQLLDSQKKYKFKYETGNFKFKRWFYGMGKEFSRISWVNSKSIWTSFIVVIIITLILALIFLGIDTLFSL